MALSPSLTKNEWDFACGTLFAISGGIGCSSILSGTRSPIVSVALACAFVSFKSFTCSLMMKRCSCVRLIVRGAGAMAGFSGSCAGAEAVANSDEDVVSEGENERSGTGHDDAGGRQAALPGHRVGEGATRDLTEHAGHAADRQRKPDKRGRPAQLCEIKRHERAKPGLHVRDEEIHPIEAAAASRRGWGMQGPPSLSVAACGSAQFGSIMT
jgi:hypothetical protein